MNRKINAPYRKANLQIPIVGFLAIIIVLFFSGCDQALEAHKRANEHLSQGRYEQAIAEFEQALAFCHQQSRKPCDLYEQSLADAKRRAGEHYFGLAQKAFAETDLGKAQQHITRAIEYAPQDAVFQQLRRRILEQMQVAEELRRQALALADGRQWDQAIETLQKALGQYRSLPNGTNDLNTIRQNAYEQYLTEARALLAGGDWDSAVAQANTALSYYSNGREAKQIIQQVANQRQALALIEAAKELLTQNQDPQSALNNLQQARQLYPSHPEVAALIVQAKQAVCDQKISAALQRQNQGDLHGALRQLRDCKRLLDSYGNIDALIGQIQVQIAESHIVKAVEFREQNLDGNALLHSLLALSYIPDHPQAGAELYAASLRLRERTEYALGYVGFQARPDTILTAQNLDSSVLVHLHAVKPPNAVIVDCMPFKTVLGRISINIADVSITDVRIQSDKPKDVDALLIGQVLDNHIEIQETTTYGKSRYQSGLQAVPNPDYTRLQNTVQEITRKLQEAQTQLTEARTSLRQSQSLTRTSRRNTTISQKEAMDTVTASQQKVTDLSNELTRSKASLAAIPPHHQNPVHSEHRYPIVHVTKTARLVCLLRFVHPDGAILLAEQITGLAIAEDDYVQPDPAHNVPADPLQMPSETTMIALALEDALSRIFALTDGFLWNHGNRFLSLMQQARNAAQQDLAIEHAVKYLFAQPVINPDSDRVVRFLTEIVNNYNGGETIDLKRMLRERCGVFLSPGALPADIRESANGLVISGFRRVELPPNLRCPCTLTMVEGIPIHSLDTLNAMMSQYGEGRHITLTVEHNGQYRLIDVNLVRAR
ncbi:MAG: hypothetical protein JXA82_20005 [Sedimentisphaerales bacterium]|nr:hypothetical protein [Sedimentisphaerales bacterium]